jgi:hypothetical protein
MNGILQSGIGRRFTTVFPLINICLNHLLTVHREFLQLEAILLHLELLIFTKLLFPLLDQGVVQFFV